MECNCTPNCTTALAILLVLPMNSQREMKWTRVCAFVNTVYQSWCTNGTGFTWRTTIWNHTVDTVPHSSANSFLLPGYECYYSCFSPISSLLWITVQLDMKQYSNPYVISTLRGIHPTISAWKYNDSHWTASDPARALIDEEWVTTHGCFSSLLVSINTSTRTHTYATLSSSLAACVHEKTNWRICRYPGWDSS